MVKILANDRNSRVTSQEQFDKFCDILETQYNIPSAGEHVDRTNNQIVLTSPGGVDEFVLMKNGQIVHYMDYPDDKYKDTVVYDSLRDCLTEDESSVIYFIYANDLQDEILA